MAPSGRPFRFPGLLGTCEARGENWLTLSKPGFFDSTPVCSSLIATPVNDDRRGSCKRTDAGQVPGFMAWASGRARLVWINGGSDEGNPCGNRAYHGFVGRESAVVGFVGRAR